MYKKGEFVYGYEIVEPLGSGAICQTYKAVGPNGKFVTMKVPSLAMVGDASTYERFLREAKIGKQLVHPAIPRTLSLFENCEAPCLVLEYVEGQTLRSILADHAPFSLEEASWIIRQLASALIYLHNHGVYHRDLKPENVLLDSSGRVHIIDFGIALLEGARRVTWRNLSDVLGTPDYISPEQIQGKRGDARSDLYSLGIMFYEMMTATTPFSGDNPTEVMNLHLTTAPAAPGKLNPAIHPNIEAIILKTIRKNPKERYQTAEEFLNDLKNYKELNISNFPRNKEKVTGVVTSRQIWVLSGIIAFVFLAAVGIIIIIGLLGHHH
jgi:serine/threonine-protein kinase